MLGGNKRVPQFENSATSIQTASPRPGCVPLCHSFHILPLLLLASVAKQRCTALAHQPGCDILCNAMCLWRSNEYSETKGVSPGVCMMQDACTNPDDLLPGLCALAQRWLADVALPGFRDAPSQAGSLADWFDDRRVALYLQVIPCHPHTLAAHPSCVIRKERKEKTMPFSIN